MTRPETEREREERLADYEGRPDVRYMRRLAVWAAVIAAGLMAGAVLAQVLREMIR